MSLFCVCPCLCVRMRVRVSVRNLGITKNNSDITLTAINAKVCYALLLNRIRLEIGKFLWKIQNGFRRNRSTTSDYLSNPQRS